MSAEAKAVGAKIPDFDESRALARAIHSYMVLLSGWVAGSFPATKFIAE